MPMYSLGHTRTCAAPSSGGRRSGALVQPGGCLDLGSLLAVSTFVVFFVVAVSLLAAWPIVSSWACNSAELHFAVASILVGAALVRDSSRYSKTDESNMNSFYAWDDEYDR